MERRLRLTSSRWTRKLLTSF